MKGMAIKGRMGMTNLDRILVVGLLVLCCSGTAAAQDLKRGADEYKLCASCHGFRGEGNSLVNAPSLAGQEAWYLKRQILHFRDGIRGASKDDQYGHTMHRMALGLESDARVDDLVAYIGKLPARRSASTLDGNAEQGKTLYTSCAACHGAKAEGNAVLNAPALTTTEDWYQARQIQLFRKGLRGAHADDTYGQQMRPMANVLKDEAAIRDVVAYIDTLK